MAIITKVVSPVSQDTERSILHIAPEQECLDWICYRLRGGVDPAGDAPAPKPPAATSNAIAQLRGRPVREDIERALGHLVNLGMLTYDGRRWSMTSKGYAAI
jgi:hypothetical protein